MPLDPQVKAYLDDLATQDIPPIDEMSVDELRENTRKEALSFGDPQPVAKVEDIKAQGLSGSDGTDFEIPIRIYTPDEVEYTGVFVFYHGGGWVTGDLASHDDVCRRLANMAACKVVSVDYRLAPENKYPDALNDCYAATLWVFENASLLGVDPRRIAVGGDSAGGNLAASVAQMARDRGDRWPIFQVLTYPVADYNFDTISYRENADGYGLTRDKMKWFWGCYLAREENGAEPGASPIRAENFSRLPPALVQTAQYDPLRDEGENYARRLKEAGVPVTLTRYDGMIHGFFRRGAIFDRADVAVREVAEALKQAFS